MVARSGISIWHRSEPHAGYSFSKPSRVKAEFQDECDINILMARYQKTGVISHVSRSTPRYLDLSEVPDLQVSMNVLASAKDAFMRLPASVRSTFDNDPVKFVEFAQDPANLDQMRKWDLAPPAAEPPAPMKVEVIEKPSKGGSKPPAEASSD